MDKGISLLQLQLPTGVVACNKERAVEVQD